MAVPSYTTDLTSGVITECESITSWGEPTGFIGGALAAEDACFIQNPGSGTTHAISKSMGAGNALAGGMFDSGSGKTIPSPGAVMTWLFFGAPNSLDTQAAGGMQILIGSALTAFQQWYVFGGDTYALGGWRCIPVDPAVAQSTQTGTPSGTKQFFGATVKLALPVTKGNPFGIDVIRYGRCEARIAAGSGVDGYATFAGFVTTNDTLANRWGLLQAIPGGYFMQGLVIIGYGGTCNFRDLNRNVFISDCEKVISSFNAIEIRGASSVVDMTAISFTALGTTSRGNWITTDNADINLDSCTFIDMGTFGFLAQSTVLNSTFRRCNLITTGGPALTGAIFTNCIFDKTNDATRAVITTSPANAELISGSTFISSGTKYGLEIGGTAANMTLTNCTWTGYNSDTSSVHTGGAITGNEAVFINIAGGSMTLTISGGTTPSVASAGCSVTVATSSRTIKVAVTKVGGVVTGANVYLAASGGATGPFPSDATAAVTSIIRSGSTATVSHTAHGMANNDQVNITGITNANKLADNSVHTITWLSANSYTFSTDPSGDTTYTGTIKSTFVFLKGTATAGTSGNEISMSRAITSSQPVTGWARLAGTSAPYYKEGAISGTVLSTGDTTFSPVLISDD